MQNEPQLSAEMEKDFNESFNEATIFGTDNFEDIEGINHPCYSHYGVHKAFKHFLATALEEQRMKVEVETGLKNFRVTMEEIAKARQDERQKLLAEVEGWLLDENVEFYKLDERDRFIRRVRNQFRAELRAKVQEMKEGKDV